MFNDGNCQKGPVGKGVGATLTNNWTPRGDNGVLITAGEIRTIEFWPYHHKEAKREQ